MSTRLSLFDSPLLLGFDHYERTVDRLKKNSDGYPPYNIEQIGENALRITLAVAGFSMDDLSVEMEQNQLTVRGKQQEEADEERMFLHRGIAARQFQRSFVLADGIEVKGAYLDKGLLYIDLVRHVPEREIKSIPISSNEEAIEASDRGGKSRQAKKL